MCIKCVNIRGIVLTSRKVCLTRVEMGSFNGGTGDIWASRAEKSSSSNLNEGGDE